MQRRAAKWLVGSFDGIAPLVLLANTTKPMATNRQKWTRKRKRKEERKTKLTRNGGGKLVVLERQFSIAVYRVLEVAVAEWYQTERLSASFNGCD